MTNAQIKAIQDLCRHRFNYKDLADHGPFAKCLEGCGFEWGMSEEYKALQKEKDLIPEITQKQMLKAIQKLGDPEEFNKHMKKNFGIQ